MTAAGTVFSVYYLLIVPIGIGFLSHAYRHFFQAPLELPSGSEFTSAFGRILLQNSTDLDCWASL
jgi:hypothetical protein